MNVTHTSFWLAPTLSIPHVTDERRSVKYMLILAAPICTYNSQKLHPGNTNNLYFIILKQVRNIYPFKITAYTLSGKSFLKSVPHNKPWGYLYLFNIFRSIVPKLNLEAEYCHLFHQKFFSPKGLEGIRSTYRRSSWR